MTSIFAEFQNLRSPKVMKLRHYLSGSGYSDLILAETPDKRVLGSLSTTKTFPPQQHEIWEADVPTAITKLNELFWELHPEHVCTATCAKHWEELLPGMGDALEPAERVN